MEKEAFYQAICSFSGISVSMCDLWLICSMSCIMACNNTLQISCITEISLLNDMNSAEIQHQKLTAVHRGSLLTNLSKST